MKTGFIGRFQPFHKGHLKSVRELQEDHEVVLVLGVTEKRGRENPLTFEERKEIIRECLPEIEIIGLEDTESDEDWIEELQRKTGIEAVATRNENTREVVKEFSDLDVIKHSSHQEGIYSGTEVRRRIRSGEEWRYLVPDCAMEAVADVTEQIKGSGIDYEFKPGWKKENAFYDTLGS